MRTTLDRIRQALAFEILGILIVTPLFAWLFVRCEIENLEFPNNPPKANSNTKPQIGLGRTRIA